TEGWTAPTTTNAPLARWDHTAVWAGGEMIVWGGYQGYGNALNSGGRYNPANDSWTATSTTGAPDGRGDHTAVWTGGKMVVWGGFYYDGSVYYLDTRGRNIPRSATWAAPTTTTAPTTREVPTRRSG